MNSSQPMQSLQKHNRGQQAKHLFFNSPIKLDPQPTFDKLTCVIFTDTLYRLFLKKGLSSDIIWGFNAFTQSLETYTSKPSSSEESKDSMTSEVVDEVFGKDRGRSDIPIDDTRFNYSALRVCWEQEDFWHESSTKLKTFLEASKAFNTIERKTAEKIWQELAKLWQKEKIDKQYSLNFYNPLTKTSFSPEMDKSNIIFDKQKSLTPIVKLKATDVSKRKLIQQIQSETEKQIQEQEDLQEKIVNRLFEIRELGVIGRKSRLDILRQYTRSKNEDEGDDSKTTSFGSSYSRYKGINWDNFKTDTEFEEEVVTLRDKLEILEENLETLLKLKARVNNKHPVNILAWLQLPFVFPATVALGVNAAAEYSLYYLENNKEFVIVAEERAIPVISLILDPTTINSEEINEVINQKMDGGEYFDKIGEKIFKIATFTGMDIEGIEYEYPLDSSWWKLNWSEKSNCHKIYAYPEVATDKGTGIQVVAPAYGFTDFEIAKQRNLPMIEILDQEGKMLMEETTDKDLALINGQSYKDIGGVLIGILDRKKAVFATFTTLLDLPFYNIWQSNENSNFYEDRATSSGNENGGGKADIQFRQSLYLQAEKNYALSQEFIKGKLEAAGLITEEMEDEIDIANGKPNYASTISITNKNQVWGLPFPLWQTSEGDQMFVKSLSQIALKAVNPIYILLNHRDLNPRLYETGQILIFTDKNTKLPLGINAVQYRSNIMTDLRREKVIDIDSFSLYASKIMDEIYNLFLKYPTIQIILDNNEQLLLSAWLNGSNTWRENHERIFYFYQAIEEMSPAEQTLFHLNKQDLIYNRYVARGAIKLLKAQRPCLDEIILVDELNNFYSRISDIVNLNVVNGLLHKIYSNPNQEEVAGSYQIWTDQEYHDWWLPSIILGDSDSATRHLVIKNELHSNIGPELLEQFPLDSIRELALRQDFAFVKTPDVSKLDFRRGISTNLEEGSLQASDVNLRMINSLNLNQALNLLASNNQELLQTTLKLLEQMYQKAYRKSGISGSQRQYYQHTLNQWWKIKTQDYCNQLQNALSSLKFKDAITIYWKYLQKFNTHYAFYASFLDGYYLSESLSCLQDTMLKFASLAWIVQPETAELLCSKLRLNSQKEALPYMEMPVYSELTQFDQDLIVTFEAMEQLVEQIDELRNQNRIRLQQPLFADFGGCTFDKYLLETLCKSTNLIQSDLSRVVGQIESVSNDLGTIKIDLVVNEELANIGLSREFEKALEAYMRRNDASRTETMRLTLQIFDAVNEDLVSEVIRNMDWNKLNLEVHWSQDLSPYDAERLEVRDLATFFVKREA